MYDTISVLFQYHDWIIAISIFIYIGITAYWYNKKDQEIYYLTHKINRLESLNIGLLQQLGGRWIDSETL